jgi:hypothetical protein
MGGDSAEASGALNATRRRTYKAPHVAHPLDRWREFETPLQEPVPGTHSGPRRPFPLPQEKAPALRNATGALKELPGTSEGEAAG